MAEPEDPRDTIGIIGPVEAESVYQLTYLSRFLRNQLINKYLTAGKPAGLGFEHDQAVQYLSRKLAATCLILYDEGRVQVSVEELHLRSWATDMPKAIPSESRILHDRIVELSSRECGTMSKEYDELYSRKKQEEGSARALETMRELFSDYQRLPMMDGQKDLAGIGRLLMKVWDATSANKKPTPASIVQLFIHIWNSGTPEETQESSPVRFESEDGPPPSTQWCEELGYNYYDLLNKPTKYLGSTPLYADPVSLDAQATGGPDVAKAEQQPSLGALIKGEPLDK